MKTLESLKTTSTHEQKKLLEKLEKSVKKEEKLEKIMIKKNYPFTCEDEDKKFPHVKIRGELTHVREDIRNYLIEADELGMGDSDIVLLNYEEYVGESLTRFH